MPERAALYLRCVLSPPIHASAMHSNFTPQALRYPAALLLLVFLFSGLQAQSGLAVLRIENLTKVPGSDRGFPADDFYTFQRVQNPINSVGQLTLHTEESGMRLHNDGTSPLVITRLTTTDTSNFTITGADIPDGGLSIAPGAFRDVRIHFVTDDGPDKRLITETLVLESNASNAGAADVTFRGAYTVGMEGNAEISAQQVFNAFGFTTSFGRDAAGELVTRPSSDYPTDEAVDGGKEGDMILSRFFVQADSTQPIRMLQLSALHFPSGAPTELRDTFGRSVVGEMLYNHGPLWHQTLLPRRTNEDLDSVAGDFTERIVDPFQILIAGYRSSGGGLDNQRKDELLGIRVYLVKDRNGRVVPNEYIVNQDFIGNDGCGLAGSANCDWNDNTSYIINARPLAEPTATRIESLTVPVDEQYTYTVNGSFDKGYPGNRLTYTASLADGLPLPSWITIDSTNATLRITAPATARGRVFGIRVTATDYNLLQVSSSFSLLVDAAGANCTVEANTDDGARVLDCTSGSVQLGGTTSTGTYAWTGPQGFTSSRANPSVSVAGTYTLSGGTDCGVSDVVEVLPASGCGGAPTENIPPVATARANPSRGPAPLEVRLGGGNSSDADGTIVGYAWQWPGGAASGRSVTTTFTDDGRYPVVLTVTDDRGATAKDTVVVIVGGAPVALRDSLYLEAECAEVGGNWMVDSTEAGASEGSYVTPLLNSESDTPPDDLPENRVRFIASDLEEGFYTIAARISAAGSASDSYWVRVNDGSWYRWGNGIASGAGFQWNVRPGEEFFLAGTNTVDFAFREADTRLDKLFLNRSDFVPSGIGGVATNCSDTSEPDTTTTNLFSPENSFSFTAFPNPTTESVTVQYSSSYAGPLSIDLFDVHSRRVRRIEARKQAGQFSGVVELGELPRGWYLIRVAEGKKTGAVPILRQ